MDRAAILRLLLASIAESLPPGTVVDPRAGWQTMGLDSLRITQLSARLSEALGRPVSPLDLWEHPSVDRLAAHLAGEGPGAPAAPLLHDADEADPIAIIGMACRFPGAPDPDAFWSLLIAGIDAVGPVPPDRWPEGWERMARSEEERAAVAQGGWIDRVMDWDPAAFGVSPREAGAMDPQQRLAMELCFEALEDAGVPLESLPGSDTGVYAAAIWSDHAMVVDRAGLDRVDQYAVTGWHHSIIANRVSYTLGLRGPSLTIDAACSSALVALHLAAEGLRRGESGLALVAAVNLNLVPESALSVARFGALSRTGRCRTFDAGADGYVRGEGGGVVVLKRLSAALRDGDRVHGIVRGSAVNNDGASAGLTAPNPDAQADLLRASCAAAGVAPAEVQFVEAHGTGTPLGDPIEARAMGAVYGGGRRQPLLVGSAKTNVGHLEGAAGMVGLLKATLALRHGVVPPNLHFEAPNAQIDPAGLGIEVPVAPTPFPDSERAIYAGVSSFGLGGTNGHVVLEAPPVAAAPPRRVVDRPSGPGPAFLFPGQGAQWAGMARALYATEPVFRRVLDACAPHVARHLGWSLVDELLAPPDRSRLDRIDVSLPLIIAFDIAMAALWRARGVEPGAVLGHSTGEIAAACTAGALDLPDAMQVICAYARAIARTDGAGRMVLVEGDWGEIGARLAGTGVFPAIWDSVEGTVIGGSSAEVEAASAALQAEGRVLRQVRIRVCPHTPVVEPLLADLARDLEGIRPRAGRVPFYSEVTGGEIPGEQLGVEHWVRNFGGQALFSAGVDALIARGHRTFVDVGPHPTTQRSVEANLRAAGLAGQVYGSSRRGEPRRATFDHTLAALAAAGWAGDTPEEATLLLLTARDTGTLAERAGALADRLAEDVDLGDLAWTLAARQTHHAERLALVGDRASLRRELEAVARGEAPRGGARVGSSVPRVAFVFPGQGSQWLGMGRELLDREPAFRAAMEDCDAAIAHEAGFSVLAELRATPERSRLGEIDVVQPVLFAVEVALAALWRAWGVEPDVVVGHSMGEAAAAAVAGALSLEDAAAVICRRSRLLRQVRGQGLMLLTELTMEEAAISLRGREAEVGIASCNGPRSTVLAGPPAAIQALAAQLDARGVFCRPVKVDVASHSPQMDPLLPELRDALGALSPRATGVPMRSTVRGRDVGGEELDAGYWCDNLRAPVRFAEVVRSMVDEGPVVFVEMSPHPILTASVEETLRGRADASAVWPSLRRGQPERAALLETLGRLVAAGRGATWAAVLPPGRVVDVPRHPWRRQRLCIEAPAGRVAASSHGHAILGDVVPVAERAGEWLCPGSIPATDRLGLRDHRVHGEVIVPGAAWVDLTLAAARAAGLPAVGLRQVEFEQALGLSDAPVAVQVAFRPGARGVTASITSAAGSTWQRHASAELLPAADGDLPSLDLAALRSRVEVLERRTGAEHHRRLREAGIDHGPAFQGVAELWTSGDEALARVSLSGPASPTAGLSPRALDVCLQVSAALGSGGDTFLPARIEDLVQRSTPPATGWVYARLLGSTDDERRVTLVAMGDEGQLWLEIGALRLRRLRGAGQGDALAAAVLVETEVDVSTPGQSGDGALLALGAPERLDALVRAVPGRRVVGVEAGAAFAIRGADRFVAHPRSREDLGRVLVEAFGVDGRCAEVVHLGALDGPAPDADPSWLDAALDAGAASVVALAQALGTHGFRDLPRLVVAIPGAGSAAALGAAPLAGILRTLALEEPALTPRLVRVDDAEPDYAALLTHDAEPEVRLAAGRRFARRLERGVLPPPPVTHRPLSAGPAALYVGAGHQAGEVALRPAPARTPGPGEVRIAVERVGLNFLDVLQALGVYPGAAAEGPLGHECAGRVIEVGPGVDGLQPGDEVVGMGTGAFATEAVLLAALVAPRPAALSWEEAATTPIAFLTAAIALEELARIEPGERVLIHAGAGGVGQAAIQLARALGAEVIATASSPEKRALVRSLGATVVADSRSASFVDTIREATGGEGVDVVLNSLAGPLAEASLSLLRPDGRFIELGKRDAAEDRPLSTRRFLDNLTYALLDLRGMMQRRPGAVGRRLRALMERFARGDLRPTPVCCWPVGQARAAFLEMAGGGHTGRIALDLRDPDATVAVGAPAWTAGTVVITGGLGGLGLVAARRVVERGGRHLVLVGRSAPGPAASAAVDTLRASGADVRVVAADVTDPAAVRALFSLDGLPPVRGVLHAAAVLDDRMLPDLDRATFDRVFAAKARGAWNLHRASLGSPLDFFVLFSSAASLLGSPAQAHYAAANAFLDGLAQHRRMQGLPALSVQWGAFSEVGLAAAAAVRGSRIATRGFLPFRPEEGMDALERVLGGDAATVGLCRFDARRWVEFHPSLAGSPELAPLLGTVDAAPTRAPGIAQLRGNPTERRAALVQRLRLEAGAVLRADPARIDPATPFRNLGVDSLLSLELRNRLEPLVGRPLSATLLYTYTTIDALAAHLLELVPEASTARVASEEADPTHAAGTPAATAEPARVPPAPAPAVVTEVAAPQAPVSTMAPPFPASRDAGGREPVAVVGMACRFPGGGTTPERYLQALEAGVDGIRRVSPGRWPEDAIPGAGASMRWAGLVDDVDQFDAAFFGIAPSEAAQMDPQHRLLLELSWEALERAGIAPDRLAGTRTGVFFGLCNADYSHLVRRAGRTDDHTATGTLASTAAGRISYLLGLEGPCLTVDTACSSSLAAVHLALRSLRDGECDLALVGGANLLLDPLGMPQAAGTGALSPDGRCRSFDAGANGFVRGEGCGVVVLARADEARARGVRVRALLRGSAMNQDGRSASLSAPNRLAQEAMLRAALRDAGLSADDLDLVETHGTGTSLGDPIEFEAIRAVLGAPTVDAGPLVLGAVKSQIGHLESAAGVAGLIKVVQALDEERIPGNLHFRALNPRMTVDGTRIVVPTSPRAWPRGGRPRRAGVSSFGISGTNVHVVVEEGPAAPATSTPPRPAVVPLSARTPSALRALASGWADALEATPQALADVATTALLGRAALDHRAAVLASDAASLRRGLRALARRPDPSGALVGHASRAQEEAARAWLAGGTLDAATAGATGRTVLLPTYPWERRRHWFDTPVEEVPTPGAALQDQLRALVARVLGMRAAELPSDRTFQELGLDSIMGISLRNSIEATVGVRVPAGAVLREATLEVLTAGVQRLLPEDSPEAPAPPPPAQRGLFLTGATGFLGANLLVELLAKGEGPVECLVRADDAAAGHRRLRSAVRHYVGETSLDWSRVRALPGDLAADGFGLGEEGFRALAGRIHAVLHNGAMLDFVLPAPALAPANVNGTAEAIRLAELAGATLHHVSTVGVLPVGHPTVDGRLLEVPTPDEGRELIPCGYTETKRAAERLVLEAAARGLPARVYRPAIIAAGRSAGVWNLDDAVCRILKGCVQSGVAPILDWSLDATPVDEIARGVVALVDRRPEPGEIVQFANPRPTRFAELVRCLRDTGWSVESAPLEVWLDRIAADGPRNALHPLLPWLRSAQPFVRVRYDGTRLREALGAAAPGPIPPSQWRAWLDGMVREGFLPAPPADEDAAAAR